MRAPAILFLPLILIACGKSTDETAATKPISQTPATARVTTLALQDIVLYPDLTAQAQVTSRNISKISAEISARIDSLPVEPGQRIDRGKVVARLDCRDARIALQQAQAQLATTDARLQLSAQQLKRNEDLAARNFISGDALDQRRTEVNVIRAERQLSQSQVQAAQRNVAKCVMVSPFEAVVESKLANVGELASPGTPLVTLWDMSGLEVVADVQQKDVDSLSRADAVTLETPEAAFPLLLKRISPAQDTSARTREARLAFIKDKPQPGASGRIKWRAKETYLPADYVLQRDGKFGVFIAEGSKARFIFLPDVQEGRPALITLPGNTRVIAEGRFALKDGQAITANGQAAADNKAM
jgi:RND family efflux transporter MFP subunit